MHPPALHERRGSYSITINPPAVGLPLLGYCTLQRQTFSVLQLTQLGAAYRHWQLYSKSLATVSG